MPVTKKIILIILTLYLEPGGEAAAMLYADTYAAVDDDKWEILWTYI